MKEKKSSAGIMFACAAVVLLALLCIAEALQIRWQMVQAEDLRHELEKEDEVISDTAELTALGKKAEEYKLTMEAYKDERDGMEKEIEDLRARLEGKEEPSESGSSEGSDESTVVINESALRTYEDPRFQNYAGKGDNYDTRQYMYSTIYSYPTDVVFAGDSLVERCSWDELYPGLNIKNRGIGGDTVEGLVPRLESIFKTQPKKLFIMIGINSILGGKDSDTIISEYKYLLDEIPDEDCEIYINSILPVASTQTHAGDIILKARDINEAVKGMCEERGYTFIDMNEAFSNEDWALKSEYTTDGVHLTAAGYKLWKSYLDPYILQEEED
ncbi:MAG: hypothetical protein IKI75_07180 [Lachnospiraceae bacterium]|nr:hypothetical protein [Lachnospiraceae bacterium]